MVPWSTLSLDKLFAGVLRTDAQPNGHPDDTHS